MSTATNVQKHFSFAHGDDLKEVSSTTSKASMSTDIAHLISAILDASDAYTRDLQSDVLLDYAAGRVNWVDRIDRGLNELTDRGTPRKTLSDDVVAHIVEELKKEFVACFEEDLKEIINTPKGSKERTKCQNILQRSIVLLIHDLNNEGKNQNKT
jgi:hypothetical protein